MLIIPLGHLARIGPNHLITNDPETFKQILKPYSGYERGPWFDCLRLDPNKGNLITERNIRVHNTLRSQLKSGVRRITQNTWGYVANPIM